MLVPLRFSCSLRDSGLPAVLPALASLLVLAGQAFGATAWEIGKADRSSEGMALAPDQYERFLEKDFGWEDGRFLIGFSDPATDWPYVLPGPRDAWGGSSAMSGTRSHTLTILFGLDAPLAGDNLKFVAEILDYHPSHPPLFKVTINGRAHYYRLPSGGSEGGIRGDFTRSKPHRIEIPLALSDLRQGGNEIVLTSIDGSWLVFDQIRLEGDINPVPQAEREVFLRHVAPASYELPAGAEHVQPLLVDLEHLQREPTLTVELDGQPIFSDKPEVGRYLYEVPMPAVKVPTTSRYRILCEGELLEEGEVKRSPQPVRTAAEYVDTRMGTAHSRWMIAPGPWMPFSMVKLSPDNQNPGWMAGYDPTIESIGTFSHIHEWTMAGLGTMPVNGPLKLNMGGQDETETGYRSAIDPATEKAPVGSYHVELKDYGIAVDLTATTRCSFQRYTYPPAKDSRVMIDLRVPAEYGYEIHGLEIKKVGDRRIEGFSKQHSPGVWSRGADQDYTVHFVMEFDRPFTKIGFWRDGEEQPDDSLEAGTVENAGAYVEFDTTTDPVVQVRTGISLVSIEGAARNLEEEITRPFGWSFDAVRQHQIDAWNALFDRVAITTNDQREKVRFYTNFFRALASRNIWSDVDGRWVDPEENIRTLPDAGTLALGCDAFWNTFWNLNQMWNLVTPEWSSLWVKSQLAMFDACGWLAKGPAGMEYIPVMVAEHEIPMIVAAYQMGIRDFDAEKAFTAVKKMQTTLPGRVGDGLAGNLDLATYLKHHYVPHDEGRFSNSLEYSFDDWTVAQFAKALGREDDYREFLERGSWWKNAIDEESGYARMRNSAGEWLPDFDPMRSGRNDHYVEGNGWQLTFFVPQDVPALAERIGVDRFIERLEWGFTESDKWRFNAPNDQYWDYPVTHGNQQSMHFAFLFNWVGKPWLTQRWSRAILDRYYGHGIANAYLGDEDQGQMSAWFIMAALGLFQTDGGCRVDPIYEIGSPLFPKVVIDLGRRYGRGDTFTIEARGASRKNLYVQSASLNGRPLETFHFPASELLKGGNLILEMGPEPNPNWGRR
jgi:alpha-1,2-mannosidase, putative